MSGFGGEYMSPHFILIAFLTTSLDFWGATNRGMSAEKADILMMEFPKTSIPRPKEDTLRVGAGLYG